RVFKSIRLGCLSFLVFCMKQFIPKLAAESRLRSTSYYFEKYILFCNIFRYQQKTNKVFASS
ncbi:hypothetical protein AB8S79_00005, partial [Klebsiella pneumoniae]